MKQSKCPYCDTLHDPINILEHTLFDCKQWQSERVQWISHLENDIPNNFMNATLLNILKQSTRPILERNCQSTNILLVAFGGHTAHKINGQFVVTRRNVKRFSVSDILPRHTAGFLRSVYNKINLDSLNRVLPGS